jgi:hypothetical protein
LNSGRMLILLGAALPVFAQYGGPAILTRGESPSAMSAPEIHFQPFLAASGVYSSGLTSASISDTGDLASQSSYGVQLAWGLSGTHSWRRTKIGVDYIGSLNHFAQQTYYDSINQSLLLGITHRLTRRASLVVRESAGISSRAFGPTLPSTVPFDPSTAFIPTTDFFDNRTLHFSSQVDLTLQKSARLSFDLGGLAFLVRRRSSALYGTNAIGAHADVQYRFTRRITAGIDYLYYHYDFRGIFGATDVHGVSGSFAMQLSRLVEFSGYVGIMRVESKFVQTVPVDPIIQQLLGIGQGTLVAHDIGYTPHMGGRISRTFSKGVLYAAGGHTVTPGNGLFLTTYASTASVGYSYTGLRRWSVGADAIYSRGKSVGNVRGAYSNSSGNLSISRQLLRSLHFVMSYSARHYDSPDFVKYNRIVHNASVGLAFSPGDVPLRLW